MKCKSKMVRGAKAVALSVAVLCSLCVCFVSCNEDADEEADVYITYNADTSESSDSSSYIYATFVAMLSSLSNGCTIVLHPELTSTQLANFVTALKNTSLSNVTLDMSYMTITAINEKTFYECKNITSVILPPCVTQIPDYAFYWRTKLESVTSSSAITSIGSGAFAYCTALKTVNYNGTKDEWGEISISSGNTCLTSATIVCSDGEYTY